MRPPAMAMLSAQLARAMHVTPLEPFGAEVTSISRAARGDLRAALYEHGLLLLRRQRMDAADHIALAELFGNVFPLPSRFQHERSPVPQSILRISNDADEGFRGVGTSGWHIDGISYSTPFQVSLMRIIHASNDGPTLFLPLRPLAERMYTNAYWDSIWACCGRGDGVVQHPLLFTHPRTQAPAVCLGKINGFARDVGTSHARNASAGETEARLRELSTELASFCEAPNAPIYRHEWQDGDVIVFDKI